MSKILCRCLFVVLYFFHLPAYGQRDTASLITVHLDKTRVQDFLNSVEEQTSVHFFYDTAGFDTVRITIHASHLALRQVLDQAFANTDIYYTADGENHWFLTRDNPLDFSFTPGTYVGGVRSTKNKKEVDFTEEEDAVEKKSWIEYKVFEIGDKSAGNSKAIVTIDGFIKDSKTGEPLTGASVSIEKTRTGVATDQYGYYTLSMLRGHYTLSIQHIGMKDTRRQIILYNDGKLNIDMQQTVIRLKKVIISAQKQSNVRGTFMGVQKMDIKTIKQVPIVFGETDILRVTTTLPGVKTVGESSTGLNVRGGAADQNLILFNDATIYNPSHFFGMFSAFNPDVVKDVELYKSSIPAKYGGRLSSVLDITSREGNKKEFTGTAGIGALTSRLEIEGPLIKDKTSFILAGRTTYSDWLLNLLPDQYKNSRASFYDVNLNISHELNKNNSLYLTGYISQDHFNLNNDTTYGYGNNNLSLKWKHIFSNKLNGVVTGGFDNYKYKISSESIPVSAYSLAFSVNQYYLNGDYNYYYNTKHSFSFGINALFYKLHPGSYQPVGDHSLVAPDEIAPEQALQLALYLSDHFTINPALSIDAGIRFASYNYLGPQNVNVYVDGVPKSESSFIKTVSYGSASVIKSYNAPEYRLSVRYAFNESSSIKAGFNTQHQYIHSLSNTSSMAPTDIWKLSDPNIRPQLGQQVSLGFYKNLKSNTIETSVEVYYKTMKNYLDYESGAVLVMNPHIETDVVPTMGKAYGAEFFIKKLTGKLNGWISYTWSRTFLRMNDPTQGQLIDNGNWYPANYDMPNDVAVVSQLPGNPSLQSFFQCQLQHGSSDHTPVGHLYLFRFCAHIIY